ncbi:Reducing type I polyketide synthase [Venustampulla echinocandica]|uniref:Reducing type I polyketide synthase n=1 Tax=Venustampulla echinocandica TaxID=2656787 RepID=A0A370TCS1_9HELO|nr:Reducing type I polyketide synthase [Venustampulla echinocandica]RDL32026.1 Reducing type I polyketide synthase [Venustampulla echinocandica]
MVTIAAHNPADGPADESGPSCINAGTPSSSESSEEKIAADEDTLEPIAIVGFSLRFPDDAVSEDGFWEMLMEKRCASREFPKDRLNIDAFHSTDPDRMNTISTKKAHFLKEDVRAFDAPFFSIPPLEAASLDPQQRGLLETTYRALENAGIPMEKAKGTNTSVHVGCFTNDFNTMNWRDSQQIPRYSATGTAAAILSNRLSWFFDLAGPSMTVDTACSSGLVALDLACNGLWSGESNMGIVASSNLICSPEMNIALSNMNFQSPDGRCYSFDDRANGYSRGEGFGVLVLKRLSHAIRDGDTIRALVRSTGTNQDGHTAGGVTQPSKDSQAKLIAETYRKAGLDLKQTRFFEAHGTGTSIGDPIEARAIGESFQGEHRQNEPLGAVKTNIGHLEGTSGIAGLIKTILVLERATIPPNTNFERLNPQIDSEFFNLKFPSQSLPWPSEGLRRASVNSFGIGGANAHAVLDDAYHYLHSRNLPGNHRTLPSPAKVSSPIQVNGFDNEHFAPKLLILSAADQDGMQRLAVEYSRYFDSLDRGAVNAAFLDNLVYTLNTRRSSLPWKSYIVANSILALRRIQETISKPIQPLAPTPRLTFIFTGQGAQWHAMARELLNYPTFQGSLLMSQACLKKMGCKWSLLDELSKTRETSRVNDPEFSQTLCTAIQVALVDILREIGVVPSTVVGHSSGEISAAYCTGSINRESAIKLAYHRGVLASKLARSSQSSHCMASIGLPAGEVDIYLEALALQQNFDPSQITISCINSPKNVTISGPKTDVEAVVAYMDEEQVFARKLLVNVAYHSPQMLTIANEYLDLIGGLERDVLLMKSVMVSSVTSDIVSSDVLCAGQYWVRNMVSPVNFFGAMKKTCSRSDANGRIKKLDRSHLKDIVTNALLEIGPHSALQGPIRDSLTSLNSNNQVVYNSALVRNRSAVETFLTAAGRLHTQGFRVDMDQLIQLSSASPKPLQVLTDLPQYPFNHSVLYWQESRLNKGVRFRQHAPHDLLGCRATDWNPLEARWRLIIRLDEMPWVEDHKVNGSILYPAAGMLAMAIEAMKQMVDDPSVVGYEIKEAVFHTPLVVSTSKEGVEAEIYLRPLADTGNAKSAWHDFRLYVHKFDEEWEEICRGTVRADYGRSKAEVDNGKEEDCRIIQLRKMHITAAQSCSKGVPSTNMYRRFKEMGLDYGAAFQPMQSIQFDTSGQATAKIGLRTWSKGESKAFGPGQNHVIHPSTLDGMFQLVFVALSQGGAVAMPTMVASRIDRLWVSSSGVGTPFTGSVQTYTEARHFSQRSARCLISVLGDDQLPKVHMDGFEVTAVSSIQADSEVQTEPKHMCYHMDWKVDPDTLDSQQLEKYCGKAYKPDAEPISWFRDIEFLALAFSSTALRELAICNRLPPASLAKYTSWIQDQVDRDLIKTPSKDRIRRIEQIQDLTYLSSVCERVMSSSRGKLYIRVGSNLPKVLLGEMDPLQLIFEDQQLLEDFYSEVNGTAQCFNAFAHYLEAMVHKDPGMNILEIGAGTGAATEILHRTLAPKSSDTPRYGQYAFTDASLALVDQARNKFKEHRRMGFEVFDVQQSPSAQGFKEESYDLVIASSVFHLTESLSETMQNARKLLKPGGKLVIVEETASNIARNGFAFGLLSDWWLGSEEYRQQTPLVSEERWHEVFQQNGFSGTDVVLRDFISEECHERSLMISTALPAVATPAGKLQPIAIVEKSSSLQLELVQEVDDALKNLGGSISGVLTLEEAVLLDGQHNRHYIMLTEYEHPVLRSLESKSFSSLQHLLSSARSVLWVTKGGMSVSTPAYGMVQGLFRVIRQEHANVALVTLAFEAEANSSIKQHANSIGKVMSMTISGLDSGSFEPEYVETSGLLQINRVAETPKLNHHIFESTTYTNGIQEYGQGPPLKLNVRTPGLLDSLEFLEDDTPREPLGSDDIEMEVRAIGVNFKDCLIVLGRVNTDKLGCECAGVISRVGNNCGQFQPGDRVTMFANQTYRTYARANSGCAVKIPDNMTFAEAAAMPTAFCTAYYSLCNVAHLQKGESILIHAASGGTGQAAVQIARHIGAEIFATVGSASKKQLLMDKYNIPEDHILYSRDTSFADGIRRMTNNQGVDVVLNSLSGEGLVASWECIAPYGRFLEIGRKDIDSHGSLPMFPFIKNASFTGVDLAAIAEQRPQLMQTLLQEMMALVAINKFLPSYPLSLFSISEIEQAFRLLQSGKSSGKIVLEITKDAMVPTSLKKHSSYSFDSNASYVIAGGLGGIGRSISRRLVDRGARNLILLSRSGPEGNEKSQALLEELRGKGVQVATPICDITSMKSLQNALRECPGNMPPVKGCIQASMVLRDSTFANMSFQEWEESVMPKVEGSWNLHVSLPKGMDFFILLSSVCGVFGNPGQSNYAAGNTYQDALAHHRVACGEKATALDLGVILAEGVVAENTQLMDHLMRQGIMLPVSQPELFALLDYHCDPSLTPSEATQAQVITGLDLPARVLARGKEIPYPIRQPLFRNMHQIDASGQPSSNTSSQALDYKTLFAGATSLVEAGLLVSEGLRKKLSRVLGIPQDNIELNNRVESYGVDSLVAVELRNWLAKEMSADVAVFEILGGNTLVAVGLTVASKSSYRQVAWTE